MTVRLIYLSLAMIFISLPVFSQTPGEQIVRLDECIIHIQQDVKDIKESIKTIEKGQVEIKEMLIPRIVRLEQWQVNNTAMRDREERISYQGYALMIGLCSVIVTVFLTAIDRLPAFLRRLNGKGR